MQILSLFFNHTYNILGLFTVLLPVIFESTPRPLRDHFETIMDIAGG